MHKKRILHLIQTSGPGGAEKVFINLIKYFSVYDKTSIHLPCLISKGWLYYEIIKSEIHPILLDTSKIKPDFILINSIAKVIRDKKIDLVCSHLYDMNFYSSIAAFLSKVPHISVEHGDIHHHSKKWSKIRKKYFISSLLTNCIVCVSKFTKLAFVKRLPWTSRKTIVIYNGIPNPFEKNIKIPDFISKDGRNKILIANIANLYPVKGHIFLIKAIKNLVKYYPNIAVHIYGRGDEHVKLKEYIDSYNLNENICLLGFDENAAKYLKYYNIFVLTSLSEGFPISIIEAMAANLTILSTSVGGVPELEDLKADIMLVEPKSVESIEHGLLKFFESSRDCDNSENFTIYKNNFSIDAMAEKYSKLFLDLISKNTRAYLKNNVTG